METMSSKFLLLLRLTILLQQSSQLSLENCKIILERKELVYPRNVLSATKL